MRAAVAVVVLLSLAVAGCIAGPASQSGETQDWPTITDPTDLSYDTDSGMHVHDYWGGEEVLEVLDQTYQAWTYWYPATPGGEDARAIKRFAPPEGSVIPQGTAKLSATVTWEPREPLTSIGDVELWIKPANASQPRLVSESVDNGGTLEIPLAYEEADLPHQTVSNWVFEVHVRGSDDPYNRWAGSTSLAVQAHRGLELRPFPPHPDHWQGRTSFTLVDEQREFTRFNLNSGNWMCCDRVEPIRPANGTLVPLGTDRVEVTLSFDNRLPAGDVILYQTDAARQGYVQLEPDETVDGEKRYVLPVTAGMADTPYADASQWGFLVDAPYWGQRADAGAFDGEYTVEATVHKG